MRKLTNIHTTKTLTAGYLFSSPYFRHKIIPLNGTLEHTGIKLEASVIKNQGRRLDTYSPVSEKEHLSETERSTSWLEMNGDSLIQLQLSPKAIPGMQFVINSNSIGHD